MVRKIGLCMALTWNMSAYAETVIQDDQASISKEELQQIVQHWNPQMQLAAANNAELRRELAALTLASKKIALAAQQVSQEQDPEFYWDVQLQVRGLLRTLMINRYLTSLKLPDFEPVALERYTADRDKYALVPERRLSSHILMMCTPGNCDFENTKKRADEALAALRDGGDFSKLVEKYSDDPGTKAKGGQFRWLVQGESGVSLPYTKALFAIDKVGGYSELISNEYGLNIIRLDSVEASHYKPYEEVKEEIIKSLETEYKKLAAMEFDQRYGPSGKLVLTDAAFDEILAPYKTLEADVATEAELRAKTKAVVDAAAEPPSKAAPESKTDVTAQ